MALWASWLSHLVLLCFLYLHDCITDASCISVFCYSALSHWVWGRLISLSYILENFCLRLVFWYCISLWRLLWNDPVMSLLSLTCSPCISHVIIWYFATLTIFFDPAITLKHQLLLGKNAQRWMWLLDTFKWRYSFENLQKYRDFTSGLRTCFLGPSTTGSSLCIKFVNHICPAIVQKSWGHHCSSSLSHHHRFISAAVPIWQSMVLASFLFDLAYLPNFWGLSYHILTVETFARLFCCSLLISVISSRILRGGFWISVCNSWDYFALEFQ